MPGREDVFQKAMNDGHSAAWDQEWERAAAAYRKALEEFPENAKALSNLGLALYQQQKFDEAMKVYMRVARLTPDDPIPIEKVAQISERLGNLKQAIDAALVAADQYLKLRDPEKAIENWLRVTSLNPEHLTAHSRLAMVHEKMGQPKQAVTEFIAVASLLQRAGNPQKAAELIEHALQLDPASAEARQAQGLIKTGQLLPKPVRAKGATGPLRVAQVKAADPKKQAGSDEDPITTARKKALAMLADILFELTDESPEAQNRRGLQAIMKGTGMLSQQSDQTKIMLHLSIAIDAQTKNNETQAAEELEHALETGLKHPALYFDLGYLRSKTDRLESAHRFLQQCVKHEDYGLAARLLSGDILARLERYKEAAIDYLEALKAADALVVSPEQADTIRQLYEPLIEAQSREEDVAKQKQLCKNVHDLLMKAGWRENMLKARAQLPKSEGGPLPLAEILIQAQSSQVLEAMNSINHLARSGRLRSAMDEAYHALTYAPTYLPLHTLMGELLIREERIPDAIGKFSVIAHAYSVRGESGPAINLYRRILQLAPMDLSMRTLLIEQLTARGQQDEAIAEYIELADTYYRLAELDMARKAYTTALRLAQQPNADRSWSIRILNRMADIDMQRLDWKSALRIYEQLRTLKPDDEAIRRSLIDLNFRLFQRPQAVAELEGYVSYLETNRQGDKALDFVLGMLEEDPDRVELRRVLAAIYQRAGKIEQAVEQLDLVGNALMDAGDREGTAEVITTILTLNPPNAEQYRQVLKSLQAG